MVRPTSPAASIVLQALTTSMTVLQDSKFYPDVTETDPTKDWLYLSEGGATIVFSYSGLPHSEYTGKVLRLRKVPRHLSGRPVSDNTQEEPDDPSIIFQERVTSTLIPSEYLPKLQAVKVSPQWLQKLEEVAVAQRPIERSSKDSIDTTRRKGVLATDLVGGQGWAVEIKPKWGFLPSSMHLSAFTLPLKTQYCRYCMHSHLKGTLGEADSPRYCPLDLYSGDEARVRTALRSLWDMWIRSMGKANNLRLFNEGKAVNPTDGETMVNLFQKLHGTHQVFNLEQFCGAFVEAAFPLIMKDLISILGRLQRTLDPLDIEGLRELWGRQYQAIHIGEGEPEPTLGDWESFIQKYISGDDSSLRYHLLAYLLSATFKDCSVILRLHPEGDIKDTITVIDLDPKELTRLPKWFTLDQEIVRNFVGVASQHPVCIDGNRLQH
ncbi:hypothetical protein M422DRAFT_30421 [Sphaerobolus stellatus SS14]|uniref:Inositol-pentakisphosphate 2-kinase n=1 Tax=Sphaerobolus stellatus (strain SS14) TaxID=990650 RepID=A0A0C9VYZ1_SPHS4|nr:hypothetical protein M422DRAFT_30421 [Sphaerobolus stellatus SS14]